MHVSYNEYILGQTTIVRSYNKCQRKRAYVQELSMEKILQSKTFSVFGLLLICALFIITYKSVPFQQNEVYIQPTEVDKVLKSQDILYYRLVLNLNMNSQTLLEFCINKKCPHK